MNSINEKPAIFLFKEDYKELIRKLAEDINPYERIESLFKYHKEYNSGFLENLLTYSRQESWLQCIKLSYQELITVQENKTLDDIITIANVDIFDEETLKNLKLSIEQIEVKIYIRAEGKFITNSISPLRHPKLYLDVLSCFVWHRDNVDKNVVDNSIPDKTNNPGPDDSMPSLIPDQPNQLGKKKPCPSINRAIAFYMILLEGLGNLSKDNKEIKKEIVAYVKENFPGKCAKNVYDLLCRGKFPLNLNFESEKKKHPEDFAYANKLLSENPVFANKLLHASLTPSDS